MAKRRKSTTQRSHVYQSGEARPGFSRRQPIREARSGPPMTWIVVGVLGVIALLAVLAYALGFMPGGAAASPSPEPATARPSFAVGPPAATPLASPPETPAGDGTTATIETELGNITFEVFTESSPVAAENFINLAEASYYSGVGFHRIIPEFMIQGGDPDGTGRGGPGYTIQDEPVVGTYTRGMVAMARSSAPNSQGSQFFIMVGDEPNLNDGGYAIFGRVTSGMDVVDRIVAGETTGPSNDLAVEPVLMTRVTVDRAS